ncbi:MULTISPECIES: tetratricopeptide repeat protein [Leptolyngbya]|uniref:tetratricopeptide repeat protein n=1 Tax=Leptolyngbya TaxID=47251 RepID=UPI0016882E05|nr:tetratricopeptide repeat protein [Leptolyngbya sp. FACHB-1624]MBD1857162.1 tetratricopeptide repeat protein [Leptolyngbya sp. FACHB-1624]
MQTIEIRQTTGFDAIVSIAGSEFEITVSDPFAEQDEKLLEWYFEQWIQFPFSDGTIAKRAADSVRSYGENLFDQVFAGRAYGAYQRVNTPLSHLEIVISGDPEFQALHWEAMWDRDFARPLAIDCVMVRQRRIRGKVNTGQVQESPVLNLLIVTARPNEEKDVGYRTISRPMVEAIRDAELRVNVEIVRPGTYEAFVQHLEAKPEGFYHVVHFDLHGGLMDYQQFQTYSHQAGNYTFQRGYGLKDLAEYGGVKAFLFFEGDEAGQAVPVTADEMAERLQGRGIPVCILNACQSGKQVGSGENGVDERETSLGARLMDAGMQMVVAMGYSVTVDAAKVLMQQVYRQVFAGEALSQAVRSGRRELFDRKKRRVYFNQEVDLEDWLLPVVYGNQKLDFRLREMTLAEADEYFANRGTEYQFAGATYGFVGRDLDILKLEKGLLKHGVVLVQGMGGTGKTSLLRYLQEWWVQTNFVDRVFYFGYDVKAWTLEQICFAIAEVLFSDVERRQFQAMQMQARVGRLVQELRSRRCCLMLDNLESVTGEALAIQNTLPLEEQERIRDCLGRIAGGKSIVLLGSRSREEWLRSVYRDRYELKGLDQESRSQLAKLVLERHVSDVAKRKEILADREFERLMRLLAGYPLAIEVVLANLARQSVGEVLQGLDAADVSLDRAGGRTESILKCVEYSHSNLSEEAQKLLLCLAPFSGFIDLRDLKNYAQQLQQLEPFQDYAFEQFDAAVQEAIDWGLLAPKFEEMSQLLSIQPVFPYFLKTKLAQQDEKTREALREGFKNHYLGLGNYYYQLMNSKDAQERQLGIFFCKLEYENLSSGLQICFDLQESSLLIFNCLQEYLEKIGDKKVNLELVRSVEMNLETYPLDRRDQEFWRQLINLLDQLGRCYLWLQQYQQSRDTHKKLIDTIQEVDFLDNTQKALSQAGSYHQLGITAQKLHDYDEARNYYHQALQIKVEFNDRYSQASTYHQLGTVAQELRKYDEARNYYHQALQIYVEFNDRYSQAHSYHWLGMVAEELGKYDEACNYYQQALQIEVEFNDRYSQAHSYHQLGNVALELSEYDEARNNYQQALQIKVEFNDRYFQAITYHQLGNVAYLMQEYDEARNNYQQALQIKAEFNDRYSQASTCHQLGNVAYLMQEYDEARNNYQQALQIKAEFNDRYSQASTYHQLGMVAEELGEYEQAHNYYQQALQIKAEFNDRYSQASTYHQLGMVAEELGEYEQARNYYQQALQIKAEFNDRYSQASTYHGLGIVAGNFGEYEQARNDYQQALQIYGEFNDHYSQARIYHQLGIVAQHLREYEQARNDYQQALQIKIEFNDRHSQARTYAQLGSLAEAEGNAAEARACLQTALEIFTEFGDEYSMAIVQQMLDRLSE